MPEQELVKHGDVKYNDDITSIFNRRSNKGLKELCPKKHKEMEEAYEE